MNPDPFIFPAPDYPLDDISYNNICWIPRRPAGSKPAAKSRCQSRYRVKTDLKIPGTYFTYPGGSNKLLLYFHGNAEDIVINSDFCIAICEALKVNVAAMEYPGYSVYDGTPDSNKITADSLIFYDFFVKEMKIPAQDILIFGRSIGSGPATHLAAQRECAALMLMSPYTSIKDVIKGVAGSCAACLVRNRFKNINQIDKVKCPILLIHGKKDPLIPYTHSEVLSKKAKSNVEKRLPPNMTHNDFFLDTDILKPAVDFLNKYGVKIENDEKMRIEPSKEYFKKPADLKRKPKQLSCCLRLILKCFGG